MVFNISFTQTGSLNIHVTYAWVGMPFYEVPASVVQGWLTGANNGLILVSEGEFQSVATANVDFYPYNDATATNRPQLIVTYE